jgi:SPP1 gp7 family putative phage head morphogenesis protein
MSLFDRFRKAPANGKDNNLKRTWSEAPRRETTSLPALFHQTPRLDPVELIASSIANASMELFDKAKLRKEKDNAEPLYDHAFYQLMDNPSTMFPELDGHAVKYVTVVLSELLGECFWLKIRNGRKITDILPFPPAWCIRTPTAGDATFLFQPFGTTAGKTIQVDASDVVWFKQPNLSDPYGRGRGRTEAMGDELDADEMAAKWQKNYFYNDATPPFWANIPGAVSSDLERMRDTWGQRLGGWLNVRKPAFTNSEGLTITKLNDSVREMDFGETRKNSRDAFLQHWSIPPELFGILEASNRSTIDAAYYLFAKNVINRRLGFYERAITRQLINVDYDARLELKIDFTIPEDDAFKLSVVNEGLTRGSLTRGDWKKAMGYPVEKGDDVYIMSYSMIEVPRGQTIADVAPEPEPVVEIIDEPTVDIGEEDPEEKPAPAKAMKAPDVRKMAHWKTFDSRAKEGEGMFRAKTRTFADAQSKRVKSAIGGNPKAYKAAIDSSFKGADDALMHAYAPAWLASMTDGAHIGRGMLGMKVSPSFALYNKAFDVWIKAHGLKKAKEINTTTYEKLMKDLEAELAAGIEAGESIPNLSARIMATVDGVYDNMSTARAELIARTETLSSVNFGQATVYAEEGIERVEWLASMDADTRESHAAMDGKTVAVGEDFSVPGFDGTDSDTMEYPGGGNVAGQNCNCRCTILPVIER